ncbi:MAG TPA: squalene--hopene cyclase [Acidiferrobacter sp.]|nr:squalene--hopene cyclase [Acidiferrobacter sp.]
MKSQGVPVESPEHCEPAASVVSAAALEMAIVQARDALLSLQAEEGHWCWPLEADCTIPAEYVLMMHFMDEIDPGLQAKLALYIRNRQMEEGGWALYHGGHFDISGSVKAYYALKLAGADVNSEPMARARAIILAHGGAARANVFTRIALAQFGQVPWYAIPFMPVELMLVPGWFPLTLNKVSYWSRTVMVPLLALCSLKVRARNPSGIGISELFVTPPFEERRYFPIRSFTNWVLFRLERLGLKIEPFIPKRLRARALKAAEAWVVERLNGTGGLGAIFPAMVNAYELLDALGYTPDQEERRTALLAIQRLLLVGEDEAYCQPCVSPIWDTGLVCLTLQEVDKKGTEKAVFRALDWMRARQLLDEPGDWRGVRPHLAGGGWPFQFENSHYPDLDDTSVVAWSMEEAADESFTYAIKRAADWVAGMQSANGGFGSFDADNTHYYLNEIPFADHGALLDPPSSDVTARCITLLTRASDDDRYQGVIMRALAYLRSEQEADGSWFGRWGTNYIYGTWSVLVGLRAAGVDRQDRSVRRAVAWLYSIQRPDGGWGESNDSYHNPAAGQGGRSTAFQTAWALLGLFAAGEYDSEAARRGIQFLLHHQDRASLWSDEEFTAPGFPRVFYLKYHGYEKYFPLWALACYRNHRAH